MLTRTTSLTALLASALAAHGAPAPAAQGQVAQIDGTQADQSLGRAIASADLDGDGLPELLVGAPGKESSSSQSAGSVGVFAGHDGTLLGTAVGEAAGTRFGAALIATRDITNDGLPDLVVGAPGGDRVAAFDGAALATGNPLELWSRDGESSGELGRALTYVGDCNADGTPDVAVGEPRAGGQQPGFGPGRVLVLSGADGSTLHAIDAPGGGVAAFGWSLAGLGDLNGDGADELAVGAPVEDGLATASGAVHVVSCRDGGVLASLPGSTASAEFGHAVARGPALAGGATLFASAPANLSQGRETGRVFWLEPTTGAVLGAVEAARPGTRFGWSLDEAAGDFLAIGEPDAPARGATVGAVQLIDLRTGARSTLLGSQADAGFGASVHWILDGRSATAGGLAVGAPDYDVVLGGDEGRVEVWAFRQQ